jgi:hypothetical protein
VRATNTTTPLAIAACVVGPRIFAIRDDIAVTAWRSATARA